VHGLRPMQHARPGQGLAGRGAGAAVSPVQLAFPGQVAVWRLALLACCAGLAPSGPATPARSRSAAGRVIAEPTAPLSRMKLRSDAHRTSVVQSWRSVGFFRVRGFERSGFFTA